MPRPVPLTSSRTSRHAQAVAVTRLELRVQQQREELFKLQERCDALLEERRVAVDGLASVKARAQQKLVASVERLQQQCSDLAAAKEEAEGQVESERIKALTRLEPMQEHVNAMAASASGV